MRTIPGRVIHFHTDNRRDGPTGFDLFREDGTRIRIGYNFKENFSGDREYHYSLEPPVGVYYLFTFSGGINPFNLCRFTVQGHKIVEEQHLIHGLNENKVREADVWSGIPPIIRDYARRLVTSGSLPKAPDVDDRGKGVIQPYVSIDSVMVITFSRGDQPDDQVVNSVTAVKLRISELLGRISFRETWYPDHISLDLADRSNGGDLHGYLDCEIQRAKEALIDEGLAFPEAHYDFFPLGREYFRGSKD